MAHVRKGQLTPAPSPAAFWKHLREWKRAFWKRERKAGKQAAEGKPGTRKTRYGKRRAMRMGRGGRPLMIRHMIFSLAAFGLVATVPAPARACTTATGYRVPTNFELVRRAELIVLARVGSVSRGNVGNWEPNIRLDILRVLKGSGPAEPLAVIGQFELRGRPTLPMPTSLGEPHPSSLRGACIRLEYPPGGLVVAMFERTPHGLRQITAPFARAVEDVEATDGLWVRAVEEYRTIQDGVADDRLRTTVQARIGQLRTRRDDPAAQAMAVDLQNYLNLTDR